MTEAPVQSREVLVTFLTPEDLEKRGIIYEVVGKVSTSDRRKPEAAVRRQAAELGANVVLAYDRNHLPGLARGLAARVPDVSSLVSCHRRIGVWLLWGGVALSALSLIGLAHNVWGLEYDVRSAIADAGLGLGMGLSGFGIWLMVRGRL
jgi:hypothetical protein